MLEFLCKKNYDQNQQKKNCSLKADYTFFFKMLSNGIFFNFGPHFGGNMISLIGKIE